MPVYSKVIEYEAIVEKLVHKKCNNILINKKCFSGTV